MNVTRPKRRTSAARTPPSKRPKAPEVTPMQARLDATIRGVYARLDAWNAGVALPVYDEPVRLPAEQLGREERAALANLEANWGLSRDLNR